jgi:hypothetical protein
MRQPGVYLLWEDTTELSWSGKQAIAGLGPIGTNRAITSFPLVRN